MKTMSMKSIVRCQSKAKSGEITWEQGGWHLLRRYKLLDVPEIILHEAIEDGCMASLEILLRDYDLDMNYRDAKHQTPLYLAAKLRHASAVRMLLQAKADPRHGGNFYGQRALHAACDNDDQEIIDLLLPVMKDVDCADVYEETPLFLACKKDNRPVIEQLLKHGADPNHANIHGITPFQFACVECSVGTMELMLRHGANVNQRTRTGETPLHLVTIQGLPKRTRMLIKHGADVNKTTTIKYETPLLVLCRCIDEMSLRIRSQMEEGKPLIPKRSCPDQAPRNYPLRASRFRCFQILLESKADVNKTSRLGHTPLYFAAIASAEDYIDQLVKKGADWDICVLPGRWTPRRVVQECEELRAKLGKYLDLDEEEEEEEKEKEEFPAMKRKRPRPTDDDGAKKKKVGLSASGSKSKRRRIGGMATPV